jgi:hypothetical protein
MFTEIHDARDVTEKGGAKLVTWSKAGRKQSEEIWQRLFVAPDFHQFMAVCCS